MKKLPKIKSLGELRRLAREDARYLALAVAAANNLGGNVKDGDLDGAMRWLNMNADETDEAGVVKEVNFVEYEARAAAGLAGCADRRIAIEFSTREYEADHGSKPRGRGSWAFVDQVHAKRDDYLKFVFWSPANLTFGAAKKAAAAHFKAQANFSGVISVCS